MQLQAHQVIVSRVERRHEMGHDGDGNEENGGVVLTQKHRVLCQAFCSFLYLQSSKICPFRNCHLIRDGLMSSLSVKQLSMTKITADYMRNWALEVEPTLEGV